jgi:hypothetical protein
MLHSLLLHALHTGQQVLKVTADPATAAPAALNAATG